MRTTVSHAINRFDMVATDYDDAGGEDYRGAAPREVRAAACRGANTRRLRAVHAPAAVRPRAAVVRYERPRVRLSYAPHPQVRVERARLGLATLAVSALVSAAVVCGLLGLAQLRAGAGVDPQPTVAQVHDAPVSGR
ncbi:hypothetical protein [Nocardia alni]|uniref:hypothetical protein n=1 Tax=Nocardia alni TaxID=2815723 RepID=UPI001C218231|nr:hypothetical protein [Nocardia alni]